MSKTFSLHYQIMPVNPEAHLFEINLTIEKPDPSGQKLTLPSWIPGSYMIRDFARTVISIHAESAGQVLAIDKLDKSTWALAPSDKTVHIKYQVYAWDLSVRTAHLDTTHAFFNGTSVFLQVVGQENHACSVELLAPQGEAYQDWRVATSMSPLNAELHGFGTYQANDYDELIDHPVEMGCFSLATFDVAGVPHDIVLTGKHQADMQRLCHDLQIICHEHVRLFGELPAMSRYVFLVMVVGEGYGGLEHRASTALLCSRNDLPIANQSTISDEYRGFLGLCSHEYFHTWNIKRIKPEAFLPYTLDRESYTQQLWAFEGITSYYDDLALVRSGLISQESYFELLGQVMTRVWRGKGRLKQSVAESSFDTWTKFYKQDESAPNNIVSYYTKGALIALALDLTIRQLTSNTASLDNVMQRLWQEYGKPLTGVPEKRIEEIASEVAGQNLDDFFQHYLYQTDDISFATLLEPMGVQWQTQPTTSLDDKGGKFSTEISTESCWLGIRTGGEASELKVLTVMDDSPAQKAGLSAGDVLVAINGLKTGKALMQNLPSHSNAGDKLHIHAFRRDELMEFNVILEKAPLTTCAMQANPESKQEQNINRAQWLNSKLD